MVQPFNEVMFLFPEVPEVLHYLFKDSIPEINATMELVNA